MATKIETVCVAFVSVDSIERLRLSIGEFYLFSPSLKSDSLSLSLN